MKYYSLAINGLTAVLTIFGDITSLPWYDGDTSAKNIADEINEIPGDVTEIEVWINSNGGEIKEGLAIYNLLKNSGKKITTTCFGFACSIASVIFMAGSQRVMLDGSMLMVHNPWVHAAGNAEYLRKTADTLDKMEESIIGSYRDSGLTEEELTEMLDAETWLTAEEAFSNGFATKIERHGEIINNHKK